MRLRDDGFVENKIVSRGETTILEPCPFPIFTNVLQRTFAESLKNPNHIAQPINRPWRSIAKLHIAYLKRESLRIDRFKQRLEAKYFKYPAEFG